MTDDYEFGLAIAHVAGAAQAHLVDPAVVEHLGHGLQPVFAEALAVYGSLLRVIDALPDEVRQAALSGIVLHEPSGQ